MSERSLCGAQRRRDTGTCRRPAGAGTSHRGTGRCSWHGGSSPTGARAAVMQEANERARGELRKLGVAVEPILNPWEALATLAGEDRQWLDYWRERVKALDPGDMRYAGITAEQVRAEVTLYRGAEESLARTLIALAKLTPEETLRRIRQGQADLLAEAMSLALADVAMPAELASALRSAYARRLRAIIHEEDRRALPAATGDDGALVGVVVR